MLKLDNKISRINEGVLLSKNEEVSEWFNTYFVDITDKLEIEGVPFIIIDGPIEHPVH